MQRNEAIDRLRGLAIILVLGLHFFDLLLYIRGAASHDQPYAYRIFNHGYFGVIIFFVLSGYLIASTSIADEGDRLSVDRSKFYVRRATRIFPLLMLVILLGATMLSTRGVARTEPLGRAFQYLFAVPGAEFTSGFWASIAGFYFNWFRVLSDGATHGWFGLQWDVLWSLAVEEQFYLFFPWVILFCKTVQRVRVFLLCVIMLCVTARTTASMFAPEAIAAFANAVFCFDALAIGVAVFLTQPWSTRNSHRALWAGSSLLIVSYLCGSSMFAGLPTFTTAASVGLLIQGFRNTKPIRIPLLGRMFSAFGMLSYGLYLLHPLAFYLVAQMQIIALPPPLGFVIALIFVFVVAKASFVLYEMPIERALRSRLHASTSTRSVAKTAPRAEAESIPSA